MFAEHGAAQPSSRSHRHWHSFHSTGRSLTPRSAGTKIRGESTGKLNDDLPDEEEADGDMGDFVNDIGGGDDY